MYKTLLETEQTNYSTYVSILMTMVVVILGFAVYWNKVTSDRVLKEQLEKLLSERLPDVIAEAERNVRKQLAGDILIHDVNIYRALGATLQKPDTYSYSSTWYAKALIAALKADQGRQARKLAEEIVKEVSELKGKNILKLYQMKPFLDVLPLLPPVLAKEKEQLESLLVNFTGIVSDAVEI